MDSASWSGLQRRGFSSPVLVEKGAKMEVFDEYGQTPLSIANAVIHRRC